jgi:hypothetical protein
MLLLFVFLVVTNKPLSVKIFSPFTFVSQGEFNANYFVRQSGFNKEQKV